MKLSKNIAIMGFILVFLAGCGTGTDISKTEINGDLSEDSPLVTDGAAVSENNDYYGNGDQYVTVESCTSERPDDELTAEIYPQCVMVNEVIYQNSDYKSSIIGCGNADGEIKTTVDKSVLPSENDQSNFGVGMRYQYGTGDRILVEINGEWIIFRDINSKDTGIPPEVLHFIAKVKDIREQNILVSAVAIPFSFNFNRGDYVIPRECIDEIDIGDYIMVWCDDYVEETSPAILPSVYSAYLIDLNDLDNESAPEFIFVDASVAPVENESRKTDIDLGDAEYIYQIFLNAKWNNEGTAENISDTVIVVNGTKLLYDSDYGILNDITNSRYTEFDSETREALNELLSKYVKLGQYDW